MTQTTDRTATELAIDILRLAISDIYSDRNPQLTIRHMDQRAWRVRRGIERLRATADGLSKSQTSV